MHAAHSAGHVEIDASQFDEFKRQHIEIPKDCLKFGDHAVLITDFLQFVKRVKGAVQRNREYRLVGGLVMYSDEPDIDITGVDTIFCKRERYKSEREYRFAISTGSDFCDPLILEVGDLSDIAIRCNSAEINDLLQISFRSGDGGSRTCGRRRRGWGMRSRIGDDARGWRRCIANGRGRLQTGPYARWAPACDGARPEEAGSG